MDVYYVLVNDLDEISGGYDIYVINEGWFFIGIVSGNIYIGLGIVIGFIGDFDG